jgi:hypothetical protein
MAEENKDSLTPGVHFGEADEVDDNRPTSQRDLEQRLEKDFKSDLSTPDGPVESEDAVRDPEQVYAPYAVEGNDTSAYVGVSPEYMTYSDDTQKPLNAEEGPEADAEELARKGSAVGSNGPVESNPTLGGGSNAELVYSATSGEDWTAETVDRKKVYDEQAKLVEQSDEVGGSTANKASTPKTGGDQLVEAKDTPAAKKTAASSSSDKS